MKASQILFVYILVTCQMVLSNTCYEFYGHFKSPIEQIATTGVFPLDFYPTLRELLAPNTDWASSGRHVNLLTEIYADGISQKQGSRFHPEDFTEYGEPVNLTRTLLQEALAVLSRYKTQLQRASDRRLEALLQASSGQTDRKEISFNSKQYRVLATLNLAKNAEGDVNLVMFEGRPMVIKQFVDSRFSDGYKAAEAFQAHQNFYATLKSSRSRFAKPIEIDSAQNMMLFEFRPGLNSSILKKDVDEGLLADEAFKAYVLVQAAFANILIRTIHGSRVANAQKKQNYLPFSPHANNTIYNPFTGEWIVIDPY